MNYELAKQLKDAGFPQNVNSNAPYIRPDGYRVVRMTADSDENKKDWAYLPTLEELIQACGDRFWSLERDLDPDEIWGAYPANEIGDGPPTFGSTPTETVARLWLALNK
jgi:hypothetical protein